MNSAPDVAGAGIAMGFMCVIWIIAIAVAVVMIIAWWKIFAKAGYNGALALLNLIPFAGIVLILWFAFTDWPIEKELKILKMRSQQPPV